jgi:osmoprotectant transport system substrate-binding protein
MRILLAAIVALALAFAAPTSAQTFKVGSKNFTEQFIVGELYAAMLEQAGFKVERKLNLGGTIAAHEALVSGAIDLYPEYTGTGLTTVMKRETTTGDADEVYRTVKAFYEKEFGLIWLKPSGDDNGTAMVVRPETAQQMNLRTLSDLAKVAGKLRLGAGPEFSDRRDGLKGLKEVYGIQFGEFRHFAALRLRYDALSQKQVDIANGFATDWQIATEKFVVLQDDKDLFPPYVLAPVVRPDVADNPKAVAALEKVGTLIDNPTMQELNRQVEVDRKTPRAVAADFLRSKGAIP